jgi:hypothetical protein
MGSWIQSLNNFVESMFETQEEKAWFAIGVYDCFLVERNILQLTI